MSRHALEIAAGERFEFGKNWQHFLSGLDETRIAEAEHSLREMLAVENLSGKSFLDIGSGSGLFSLAARRLGARVHSFDYDPSSVACTRTVKERYFPHDPAWTVGEGSVLDAAFLESVGEFDLVYAWGVLHHTGQLWQALANATIPVADRGRLYVAIYNQQPFWTPIHTWMKRTYVASPAPLQWLNAGGQIAFQVAKGLVKDLALLRNPWTRYRNYNRARGMNWWHDTLDWIGGYPFETATPEAVVAFVRPRGFELERVTTCGRGHGCNQFLFAKNAPPTQTEFSA